MYSRILIPIEDLETIEPLVNALVSLRASENHSEVTLLHVLVPMNNTDVAIGYVADTGAVRDALERDGKEVLAQARLRLQREKIEPSTILKWGEPAHEICQTAENEQIDLIVVGSKDKNLIEKILVGSVSQRVVQHAPTHVLVVK